MEPELQRALAALRARRGFEPARYVQFKAAMLDAYLRRSGLRACVVAVSGGVDSAVTLALVREAARIPGSPVARVVAALMPLFVPHGATHQDVALARGRDVAAAFDAEVALVDLSRAHALLMASVEEGMATRSTPWAAGQLVSNLRTPALYHAATLLTQQGFPALICGTTNRDEGSYLGFFGKASDGMVDLQLISDLHKSEVFRVGQLLRVPTSVLEATPTGDTFDGRHDELMIGAPYDFVELYTGLLALDAPTRRRLRSGWSAAAEEQFARWAAAVEALHRTNAHKYLGASPAVHLDVLERAVPGGWRADAPGPRKPADFRNFVGLFSLDPALRTRLIEAPPPAEMRARPLFHEDTGDLLIENILTPDECAALRDEVLRHRAVPAGPHGRHDELDPGPHGRHDDLDPGPPRRPDELDLGAPTASWRSSLYDEALAGALWSRMAPFLPPLLRVGHLSPCDADGHEFWRVVGVSPLLRLIRYEAGGWLVPHHDGAYDEGDGVHRTLWSVLIHLTEPGATEGGETVFLLDRWRHLPPQERSFQDDEGPAPPWERLAVRGALGAALVFDHRRRHEGSPLRSGQKLVLRADLLFARCGVPALSSTPASGSPLSSTPASGSPLSPVSVSASPLLAGVAACEAPAMLPLERRLGVRAGAPRARVDQAHREAWERGERDPELRLAWKVLRDPLYGRAYRVLGGLAGLEEAGFFDDGGPDLPTTDPREDAAWWVTPLGRIEERLREAAALPATAPRVVLLSTGAFCPIHEGHVRMMELARAELERQGAVVLGGYLSPSHDGYVQRKCGEANPGAAFRVRLCEEALRGHPWLCVDPWEALHADVPLNFTEVIDRLERFLSFRLRSFLPVEVVYVFGGDNARFSLSFPLRGRSLCVARPGHEEPLARYRAHPLLQGNPRVGFLLAQDDALGASSSEIRHRGSSTRIPQDARSLWRTWVERPAPASIRKLHLLLRDEGAWCLEPWFEGRDRGALLRAWEGFLEGLQRLFHEAFDGLQPPDEVSVLEIERLPLEEQRRQVAEAVAGRRVISLDPCIPGDFNLGWSRVFPVAGGEEGLRWSARPGVDLEHQLAQLAPGPCVLLDDDEVTGETRARAERALGARGVEVVAFLTAAGLAARPRGADARVEICDARDFLAGAREAGLVVALSGGSRLARVPYALPYARPSRRASVPFSRELAFSRGIWDLNTSFFAGITPAIRVAEASPSFRRMAEAQRFDEGGTMEALCRWHGAGIP